MIRTSTSVDRAPMHRTSQPEPVASSSRLPCPACESKDFRYLFRKKECEYHECMQCRLQRLSPLPSQEEMNAYYEQSYADGMYRDFVAAEAMKRMTAAERFKQIRKWCSSSPWLEVGCSSGIFLEHLREQGIEAEGIDVSQNAVDLARSAGLKARCGTLASLGEADRFQTITAFDVLEHVLDPWKFMQGIQKHLLPGGRVAISVPNLHSWSRFLMGPKWYFYIPEEHMHFFSPESLSRLCQRAGLRVISNRPTCKPLSFDYSMIQFQEYNPWIYRTLKLFKKFLPSSIRSYPVPLYIGELLLIAENPVNHE